MQVIYSADSSKLWSEANLYRGYTFSKPFNIETELCGVRSYCWFSCLSSDIWAVPFNKYSFSWWNSAARRNRGTSAN